MKNIIVQPHRSVTAWNYQSISSQRSLSSSFCLCHSFLNHNNNNNNGDKQGRHNLSRPRSGKNGWFYNVNLVPTSSLSMSSGLSDRASSSSFQTTTKTVTVDNADDDTQIYDSITFLEQEHQKQTLQQQQQSLQDEKNRNVDARPNKTKSQPQQEQRGQVDSVMDEINPSHIQMKEERCYDGATFPLHDSKRKLESIDGGVIISNDKAATTDDTSVSFSIFSSSKSLVRLTKIWSKINTVYDEITVRSNKTASKVSYQMKKQWRRLGSNFFSMYGFLLSSFKSLFSINNNPIEQIETLWLPNFQALIQYLQKNGLDTEVRKIFNRRLLDNIIILGIIHKETYVSYLSHPTKSSMNGTTVETGMITTSYRDRRCDAITDDETTKTANTPKAIDKGNKQTMIHPNLLLSKEASIRYVRLATAAYGEYMIRSSEMDRTGSFSSSRKLSLSSPSSLVEPMRSSTTATPDDTSNNNNNNNSTTSRSYRIRKRICEYCSLANVDDIIHLDIDSDSTNPNLLRHFIALDHTHQEIIFSIRGTFSLSELFVDVAGFTKPFCDGEAHAEIATMAERLWDANEETIISLLRQYPSYEFIIVGHSLGAGTASLMNMLCHCNPLLTTDQKDRIRCIAFACPPVYSPISSMSSSSSIGYESVINENVKRALNSCISFLHENDCVPFMSVDSLRHLCYSIKVIEDANLRWRQRIRLITQYDKPDIDLISAIQRTNSMRLQPLPGAPVLMIPASVNIWMKGHELEEDNDKVIDVYNSKLCDPVKLSKFGLYVDLNMFRFDHMPSRYEYAIVHHESFTVRPNHEK